MILVVEDELAISELIVNTLQLAGFESVAVDNVSQAYLLAHAQRPQLILLDWMLVGGSGIDLVCRLKKDIATSQIPIIMISAKGEEDNKVYALDMGADDYMTKPFSTRELISRVKAMLRRFGITEQPLVLGRLKVDPISRQAYIDDDVLYMSATEYRLLSFFIKNAGRTYTRSQILDGVWGSDVYIDDRTVDVHIRRLRKLLAPFDLHDVIQTVRGVGYRCAEVRHE